MNAGEPTESALPLSHRGILITAHDLPGTYSWCDDERDAASLAGTVAEARRQIDAHLGAEVVA